MLTLLRYFLSELTVPFRIPFPLLFLPGFIPELEGHPKLTELAEKVWRKLYVDQQPLDYMFDEATGIYTLLPLRKSTIEFLCYSLWKHQSK